jgi:5'-3' exoribonuclease 1
MGVPGVFAWLVKKCNNIICHNDIQNNNILLLDANCAFHPQCQSIIEKYPNWNDINFIQKKMYNRIIKYIKYLVDYVKPKILYIAVDGPAPAAKINQQRSRRYKSVHDGCKINEIKKKHGIKIPKKTWSSCAITPGTKFMNLITKSIRYAIDHNLFGDIECIFSSDNDPGEGEHKIFRYLKLNRKNFKNKRKIIYGLDADLIFLSLASGLDNLYLLRESQDMKIDSQHTLNYVNVTIIKEFIVEYMRQNINYEDVQIHQKTYKSNEISDFIVISYFVGNDFIPRLPSIDMRVHGLDLIIKTWSACYNKLDTFLVNIYQDHIEFNNTFLQLFITKLATLEIKYFTEELPIQLYKQQKKKIYSNNKFELDVFKLNNLQTIERQDIIQLGHGSEQSWKRRYYTHYFGKYNSETVNNICHEYLRGLHWIANYYFLECCSWSWYYPEYHSPILSDFRDYLINTNDVIKFNVGKILTPSEQLLAVIPPQCSFLLPTKLRWLVTNNKSPIIDLYPSDFEEDTINKYMLYQTIPILPKLNLKRIINAFES